MNFLSVTNGDALLDRWNPDALKNYYDVCDIAVDYLFDSGYRALAKGDIKGGCEIVRLFGGCHKKVVTFAVNRIGDKYELPDPTPASSNEVLMLSMISPMNPMLLGDGTWMYAAKGQYVYGIKDNSDIRDVIIAPSPPYLRSTTLQETKIEKGQFKKVFG